MTTNINPYVQKLVDALKEDAQKTISKGKEFVAYATLINTEKKITFPVLHSANTQRERNLFALQLELIAELEETDYLVMAFEGWRLKETDSITYNQVIETYGSLSDYPHQKDEFAVIAIQDETTTTVHSANIIRKGKKSVLGNWEILTRKNSEFATRYSNVIKAKVTA